MFKPISRDPSDAQRLPIKVILPKQGTERRVAGGGGPLLPFRPVTPEFRASLRTQISAIRDSITTDITTRVGAVPIRIKMIPQSVAKSHRPENLFSVNTCPIVGAGALGELFLKGTKTGLSRLVHTIQSDHTDRIVKELSSIQTIEPVTPTLRRSNTSPIDILRRSPRRRTGFLTRVKLFDYRSEPEQELLLADFLRSCRSLHVPVQRGGYSPKSFTFEVECNSAAQVEALSNVVGICSIQPMPVLRTIQPRVLSPASLPSILPPAPQADRDFPIVAIVDTGIATTNPRLNSWIVGQETFVVPSHRNPTHGTFVAGLVCWGALLNPNLQGISDAPCGLFDVQILPNSDPDYGDTEDLTESEFLESLDGVLQQQANRIKVWNFSLSTNEVCSLDAFSPFAQQLDDLQEKYQVSFVISAGNYNTLPLLDYPRNKSQLIDGRITSPADSVLGITVGSISQLDYKKDGPKLDHPSPFSRHGAGPNYIIKPDLVHYGGTCSTDGAHVAGISSISLTGSGEDLGTSFSAPLVSRTLAEIYHNITPSPSPVLARALLTHHARDPRDGGRVPDGEENFFGFGRPTPPPYCLECTPHSSTLIFEDTLRPGYFLEWDDFPYPASLTRDGRYFGQIWMTVAFAPARGPHWGTEYCETHIDAHFGVYTETRSRTTGQVTLKFRGLVPPEHKNPGQLYESYQVSQLRKWAPVRTYYGNLNPNGERGSRWRLKLQLLSRHGIDRNPELVKPQPFSLIITIADPDRKALVYNEMSRVIRNRFQADNLLLRTTAQIRTRSQT